MANYASLRGPVGMNRVFVETGEGRTPEAIRNALKAGRTFASNGPLLGLELDGKRPGDSVKRTAPDKLRYRIALRSPVAVDHLELIRNGKVVKSFRLNGDRRALDAQGDLQIDAGGWLLLRAWNDGADPRCLTSTLMRPPARFIWTYRAACPTLARTPLISLPGCSVLSEAEARHDFNTVREREATLNTCGRRSNITAASRSVADLTGRPMI
jgi:hypothetical protein